MTLLLTVAAAQENLRKQVKSIRLNQGLTQKGLSKRAGVPLPTLQKYEQKGVISLEAFLKILIVLGSLEKLVHSLNDSNEDFQSIEEILKTPMRTPRKYGWRK